MVALEEVVVAAFGLEALLEVAEAIAVAGEEDGEVFAEGAEEVVPVDGDDALGVHLLDGVAVEVIAIGGGHAAEAADAEEEDVGLDVIERAWEVVGGGFDEDAAGAVADEEVVAAALGILVFAGGLAEGLIDGVAEVVVDAGDGAGVPGGDDGDGEVAADFDGLVVFEEAHVAFGEVPSPADVEGGRGAVEDGAGFLEALGTMDDVGSVEGVVDVGVGDEEGAEAGGSGTVEGGIDGGWMGADGKEGGGDEAGPGEEAIDEDLVGAVVDEDGGVPEEGGGEGFPAPLPGAGGGGDEGAGGGEEEEKAGKEEAEGARKWEAVEDGSGAHGVEGWRKRRGNGRENGG